MTDSNLQAKQRCVGVDTQAVRGLCMPCARLVHGMCAAYKRLELCGFYHLRMVRDPRRKVHCTHPPARSPISDLLRPMADSLQPDALPKDAIRRANYRQAQSLQSSECSVRPL